MNPAIQKALDAVLAAAKTRAKAQSTERESDYYFNQGELHYDLWKADNDKLKEARTAFDQAYSLLEDVIETEADEGNL